MEGHKKQNGHGILWTWSGLLNPDCTDWLDDSQEWLKWTMIDFLNNFL